jgi:hypothetical protein
MPKRIGAALALGLALSGQSRAADCTGLGEQISPAALSPAPSYPVLFDGDQAQASPPQTWGAVFQRFLDDLYENASTRSVLLNDALLYQLPPWYDLGQTANPPKECADRWLHTNDGIITDPTLAPERYLVVTDELSELALLVGWSTQPSAVERFRQLDRTIRALLIPSGARAGLPCWVGIVQGGAFGCHPDRLDTATDATVRLGLAYFAAARNVRFSAAEQAAYRALALSLLERHLALEYKHVPSCPASTLTGEVVPLCYWAAAGAAVAEPNSDGQMYIGYYPDIIKFLFAGYAVTREPGLLVRAEEVVHQFLLASRYRRNGLTFGYTRFTWTYPTNDLPTPVSLSSWDVDDAPRALWIGDVLRAHRLVTGNDAPPPVYVVLGEWLALALADARGQTTTCACVQYAPDATPNPDNCGDDNHYYLGQGLGLHLRQAIASAPDKLRGALPGYGWDLKRWYDQNVYDPKTGINSGCFFIYRGIRTPKALGALLGRDNRTFTSDLFSDGFENGNLSAWTS